MSRQQKEAPDFHQPATKLCCSTRVKQQRYIRCQIPKNVSCKLIRLLAPSRGTTRSTADDTDCTLSTFSMYPKNSLHSQDTHTHRPIKAISYSNPIQAKLSRQHVMHCTA
ncbi:hypothetical protein ACLKA6_005034 [Drosophila palustris]